MARLIILFALLALPAWSQDVDPDTTIDLKGSVYDKIGKEVTAAVLTFRSPGGRVFRTEADSKTGMYQIFIPYSESYNVTVSSPVLLQHEEKITLLPMKDAPRQRIDFYALKLEPGLAIDSFSVFTEGTSRFNKTAEYVLDYYIDIFRHNTGAVFQFIVAEADSGATGSKLTDGRIDALVRYMEKWKNDEIHGRIVVSSSPLSFRPAEGKKDRTPDMIIKVVNIAVKNDK